MLRRPFESALAAAIAVMDEAATVWPAFVNRLFQGIQDEAGMGCPADPPAHDIAGVDVDHEGHVDEAGPGRDVSEVSDPQPVRRRRVELTVHLVEWARRRLVPDRRAHRLAADHALKTEFAHQPLGSASGDLKPFAPHLPPHLAHPVNAKVLGMDPQNLWLQRKVALGARRQPGGIALLDGVIMIGRWGDRQDPAIGSTP
jgi:hypothetical protein